MDNLDDLSLYGVEVNQKMMTPIEKNPQVVAMAYVPVQYMHTIYEPELGYQHGTIFPELNKPFLAGGGIRD